MIYSIRDEYKPIFGRQILTIWSGNFASDYEGVAIERPNHSGFLVKLTNRKITVLCTSPRTPENFNEVDNAINHAINYKTPACNT